MSEQARELHAAMRAWSEACLQVIAPFMEQIRERGVSDEVADEVLNRSTDMVRHDLTQWARFEGASEDERSHWRSMTAVTLFTMGATLANAAREISPETLERMEEQADMTPIPAWLVDKVNDAVSELRSRGEAVTVDAVVGMVGMGRLTVPELSDLHRIAIDVTLVGRDE